MSQISKTHSRLAGRNAKPFDLKNITNDAVASLSRIGLVFDHAVVQDQIKALAKAGAFRSGSAMDSNFTAPVTTPSIPTPIQFLQTWLPGFVKVMTAARKIDEIIGIDTVGSWEDQEIVQGIVEPAGTAVEYGDHTNIPLTSWNANFERRTIVRGELGMMVGTLEEGRASAIRLNSAETKRQQAAIGLEIFRNAIGFYGWQSGLGNRTYGFLNDPNLPAFQTPPSQGWSTADWAGIIGDIREAVRQLRIQSQDQIDPKAEKITLALATSKVDYLSVTTPYGISVSDWIEQTYPKMRIVSAPELSGVQMKAQEPEDALVLFVEDVNAAVDGSTDGGSVFSQLVQSKFITLGVEKRAKSYVEDFSNGTAGALCKRPWAVVRYLGI
ncbi:capsid and scaffold protein [Pseudomonas virus Pa193]|uniref:Capsid and scaffold protein n=5 Tax=Pbunavirus TaxID=1198980 RepID=A0A6G9LNL4_9CAUD|nr:major head protein [Pseudomonas phage JG024]YP_009211351.1 major head protein [Pseudomonas phage vB_Pae_PS44]YP_009914157.1 major head protein [Pseudomonas virus Pa193]QIQ66987.1 capsid and scaffold protein [Pseudomonas phage shane]QJB23121.1 capsid and scaffold protein [Pseudomonas phage willy]ADF29318.1 putative major strucutral protein [Pseudomonas phage JG024]AIW01581.1 hypothetical protein vB_Pae_PS44_00027 [Pseudomonas phage vB_Pae_PS44]QDH45952.1 capsid and scaffold protein [Pseudo